MITLDVDRLDRSDRERLDAAMRVRPLLSDPAPRGSATWWWIALVFAVASLAACVLVGFGRVVSSATSAVVPVLAAIVEGALVALFIRAVFGIHASASSKQSLPWTPGRFLHPWGLVNTRGRYFAFVPASEITDVTVTSTQPGPSGMSLFTISIAHGTAVDTIVLFGFESNIPRAALADIHRPARAEDATAAANYRNAPSSRELLSREAIERARVDVPAKSAAVPSKFVARVSLASGVIAALVAWLVVLPLGSMNASTSHSASTWRAIDSAFPLPWVHARARVTTDDRWRSADRSIDARIAPAQRESLHRLVAWARAHEGHPARLVVSAPPYADMQAATAWLTAHAPAGAQSSEVIVGYASLSSLDRVPGDEQWLASLTATLGAVADADLLEIELAHGDAARATDTARIIVRPRTHADGVLRGQGPSVIAALAFDFDVDLAIPGSPDAPLARGLHVDSPDELTVARFAGTTGVLDFANATMTYAQQMTEASRFASDVWRRSMLAR